jgi:2-hydroxy-3-keto-5-methylthiopentenyl-1-phosphate phosphatase
VTAAPAPTPVPPLAPGEPPIAILVDFDGTIARGDVTAEVMRAALPRGRRLPWEEGSRLTWPDMMRAAAGGFPGDPARLLEAAAAVQLDSSFTALAARAHAACIPMEIVSDGFGFYIGPALERLDAGWVSIASGDTRFERPRPRVEFPFGHPSCEVFVTWYRVRVVDI